VCVCGRENLGGLDAKLDVVFCCARSTFALIKTLLSEFFCSLTLNRWTGASFFHLGGPLGCGPGWG